MGVFDFLSRPTDIFAGKVIRALRDAGWPYEVQYLRSKFVLLTGYRGGVLHLAGVYADWRACPRRERAATLARIITPILDSAIEETWEQASPRLLPIVRSLTDLQATALAADEPGLDLWQPHRCLAGPLATLLAVDAPGSISYVQHARVQSWGLPFEVLLDRAIENLVAKSPVRFREMEGGFLVSDYGDRYDASRLLLPELFLALQLPGEPVAVAISRDEVAVAGSEDTAALNAMAAHVMVAHAASDRPLSRLPLILCDRKWRPFEAAWGQGLDPLHELAARQLHRDYAVQTPGLEHYLASRDKDVYVPPQEVLLDDGRPFAWTSWTQNVPALLPRADVVGLTDSQERRLFRTWGDIERICGPFTPDDRLHPPRFTPPPWPDAETWRRLADECAAPAWWEAPP